MTKIDEATRDALLADPQPMRDAMTGADHTKFRGQLREAVEYALRHFEGKRASHGMVFEADAWRTAADSGVLAEHIALHLGASLITLMEAHNYETFLGALDLVKQRLNEQPVQLGFNPDDGWQAGRA